MQDLRSFFAPIHFLETLLPGTYHNHQLGYNTPYATEKGFDWEEADIILLGCGEMRGANEHAAYSQAPDKIRAAFYEMCHWHHNVKIADAGNIIEGATIGDTRAALLTVLKELEQAGKIAIVFGGSHDLFLQQYEAFKQNNKLVNVAVTDMLIDLEESETVTAKSFLMDMLTEEPNFVKHYNHIGFQSYYTHPHILETLDKLRFDFYRVGKVRDHIEEMEPVLRNTHLFSFDVAAIKYSEAPANVDGSPNGFAGDEACLLARYAGMSETLNSFGIYGFDPSKDIRQMTAKQIAQMLWYFIDGYHIRKSEAALTEKDEFIEFHVNFTNNDISFIKSKRTNRWWMQLPDKTFIPCSYNDYLTACENEIPERWLREQERLV